jgi:hypothetical protein
MRRLLTQLKDELLQSHRLGILYADEQVTQLRQEKLNLPITELP